MELLRDPELGPAGGGAPGPSGEEAPRPRMSPATIAAKVRAAPGMARLGPPLSQASSKARQVVTGPARNTWGDCLPDRAEREA